jgi:Flp pilus assembly protein TadD
MRLLIPLLVLLPLAACGGGRGGEAPTAKPPPNNVSRAALAGGANDLALRLSGEALGRDPNDADALDVQGSALSEMGRSAEAQMAYERLLAINPASAPALLGLGRLLLERDAPSAEVQFLHVLARDPRHPQALNDLGIAQDLQGRHAAAQESYRRALGVAPQMQAAVVNLALSLAISGHAADAVLLLRPIAAIPGASTRVKHDFAAAALLSGDRATAEAVLRPDLSAAETDEALTTLDGLQFK